MGKQAKKRRQLAVTLAAQAHPAPQATPKRQPAKPKPPVKVIPKTVANTDMLTGNYLRDDLPRWYLDGDNSRPEVARTAIPSRIHSSQTERPRRGRNEPEGQSFVAGLGGNEFSSAFDRYMKNVLPRIIAEEQLMWLAWWDVEYVLGRLVKHLGKETVSAAILVLRDEQSVEFIARQVQHSNEWVRRQITITLTLAETYFTHREHWRRHSREHWRR